MSKEADQIFASLKKREFHPVYFFYGEEPFYIDELTTWMEQNVLDEAEKGFNQTIVYGRDVSARDVIDLARRFPMMGSYQLVIVKEAQHILNMDEPLKAYLEHPLDSTILVINYKYKKLDKRKALYKILSKSDKCVLFESAKLYDSKIPAWISHRVMGMGYTINPKSVRLLAEYLGADLGRINNELGKLMINLKPGDAITEDLIEQNIGISKDFNIFELTNAMGKRDVGKALRIVQYFEANPKQNPLQMVSVLVYSYFMKVFLYHFVSRESRSGIASKLGVSPYFVDDYKFAAQNYTARQVREIVAELRQIDLKSKGLGSVDASSYGPLKEMIFRRMS
jgi:DNA polymerase-3 subunit delta